ncbi:hypothetical protein ABVB18_05145 [Xanthomonas citri pv. mangiferaeindicae]|uniref:hypothetical protein n=1 Tax=Xanthomonas citri TaxID=346 RepID=UPI000255241E|nr:hypothetical protein [Xanthomonas citri]OOW57825.1 hypothetical protein Xcnt_00630 [Xanthomonas campestris pv. centellae]UDB88632.1 hypothetical protein LCZ91_00965 [Xanthomonas citri pv. mangiferaeindicae]CCG35765.1 hypothetical protein XMIN_724 [Xanthomonas citri pv. mangiferaeindicae LMG 941]
MLNIIAPEASALIGGCRALQRLAVPAAMGMPLRFARGAGVERQVRWREQISGTAQRRYRYRHAARRSPLAPNLA